MGLQAIVRVSFQTSSFANKEVDEILENIGGFQKIGTAAYSIKTENEELAMANLRRLFGFVEGVRERLDYFSVTVARDSRPNSN